MRSLTLDRRSLIAVFVVALAVATVAAEGEQPQTGVETTMQEASPDQDAAGPPVEIETPGQLDVIERTAVALDARLEEGMQAVGYQWKILEGNGATLLGQDREDAVFIAPGVEKGYKVFVIQLTVFYADESPSTRTLRIRVLPSDPALAQEGVPESDTAWLDKHYRKMREAEEQKQSLEDELDQLNGQIFHMHRSAQEAHRGEKSGVPDRSEDSRYPEQGNENALLVSRIGEAFDEGILGGLPSLFHRLENRAFRQLQAHPERDS